MKFELKNEQRGAVPKVEIAASNLASNDGSWLYLTEKIS